MGLDLSNIEFSWDPGLQPGPDTEALTRLTWPRFLREPSDIPQATVRFVASGPELFKRFAIWGLRRNDTRELVAYANGVLIRTDPAAAELSPRGWHYAMDSFAALQEAPNTLCLLTANVHPDYRQLGFAQILLSAGKDIARSRGLKALVGPVRPSHKCDYPNLKMSEYIALKTDSGEPLDPWLRTHIREGAEMLNICDESVVVMASLAKWNDWLDLDLESMTRKGFASLKIDKDRQTAIYREPNVWVRYRL